MRAKQKCRHNKKILTESVLLPDESLSSVMVQSPVVNTQISSLHLFHVTVLPLFGIDLELALYSLLCGEEYQLIAGEWPVLVLWCLKTGG